ncbi:hypothetical protein GCM10010353_62970 [Streptomyces chryseus]|nr:hypothetical protein GCM10010353_62970 [Streptomyces chryseus]
MKALVFQGPAKTAWQEVPDPGIKNAADAVVRVDAVTMCGTDLHIIKGDVPEVAPGTVLGHEAVGEVVEIGSEVRTVRPGDRVLVSCISACGRCRFCRENRYGQCRGGGGWVLGHLIDGTQAEFVRVPFADLSVHPLPSTVDSDDALLLADIFPTAYEVGVLNGRVSPGDTVVVVGAGPIGLATVAAAQLYTPGKIIAVDLAESRLAVARAVGADATVSAAKRTGSAGRGPDRRSGRRCRRRSGRGTRDLRDVHPHGAPRRLRRERRRPWQASLPAPGRPVDQGPHDHHGTGRHQLDPAAAAHDGGGDGCRPPNWSLTTSSWGRCKRRTRCSPGLRRPARSRSCWAVPGMTPSRCRPRGAPGWGRGHPANSTNKGCDMGKAITAGIDGSAESIGAADGRRVRPCRTLRTARAQRVSYRSCASSTSSAYRAAHAPIARIGVSNAVPASVRA